MDELQLPIDESLQKWVNIVVDKFQKAIVRLKIGVTNNLLFSFSKELVKSGGDVERVLIKFLRYGRFSDMGVGKGVSIGERRLVQQFDTYTDSEGRRRGDNVRKAKKWYSKILYTEIAKLKYLLPEAMSGQLAERIRTDIEKL